MNLEEIMNMDAGRFVDDFNDNDLYPMFRFIPMQDKSYPFTREKLSCIVCNPYDKVYTAEIDRSMYDMYRIIVSDRHYDNVSYLASTEKHQKESDAMDLVWSEFGDALCFVSQNEIYPDNCTDRLVNAPLSLICVSSAGVKYMCYGTAIIFGVNMMTLPVELRWYLLSNTVMMHNEKFGNSVATVVYEDSLRKICEEETNKEDVKDDWKIYLQKKVWGHKADR